MVIKKYIKEYSMKEKYLLQITLKGSQSSQWISENLSQFMIHGGLIQVSEKKKRSYQTTCHSKKWALRFLHEGLFWYRFRLL